MEIQHISRPRYTFTIVMSVLVSCLVVSIAAMLGRATLNFKAALTDKPDIAIYLLLPEEEITEVNLLRDLESERHYLAETKDGPKLVVLEKGAEKWFVKSTESLR